MSSSSLKIEEMSGKFELQILANSQWVEGALNWSIEAQTVLTEFEAVQRGSISTRGVHGVLPFQALG